MHARVDSLTEALLASCRENGTQIPSATLPDIALQRELSDMWPMDVGFGIETGSSHGEGAGTGASDWMSAEIENLKAQIAQLNYDAKEYRAMLESLGSLFLTLTLTLTSLKPNPTCRCLYHLGR